MIFVSRSKQATQKYAAELARALAGSYEVKLRKSLTKLNFVRLNGAAIFALEGDLGAGKTTFVQGFTRALGIRERVASPTFILMNVYELPPRAGGRKSGARPQYRHLVHIDCYRIESPDELLHLALDKILKDRDAIVLIEWADRIRALLPQDVLWLQFRHGAAINERIIELR